MSEVSGENLVIENSSLLTSRLGYTSVQQHPAFVFIMLLNMAFVTLTNMAFVTSTWVGVPQRAGEYCDV